MQCKDGEELKAVNEIVFNKVANELLTCTETSEMQQYPQGLVTELLLSFI